MGDCLRALCHAVADVGVIHSKEFMPCAKPITMASISGFKFSMLFEFIESF
jgi:hypothetical protein